MVEIKETPKIVVAKPVACRPTLSGLRSFSELVSGAVNAPPQPPSICEPAVAAIRPKTIRFKPAANVDSVGDEGCGPAVCRPSERVLKTNIAPNVVYKPIAKLVSKRTVSLLANLGGGCGVIPRPEIADSKTPISPWNQDKPQTELATDFHQSLPSKLAMLNASVENTEDNIKLPVLPHIGDRSSYDGHSWRKYGQKQVKGSEYPRSYYKCTHPNCPVKKKVEKTLDGQIAEIVYSGEHNHSKPQLLNRIETPHEGCEGRSENPRIMGSSMHSPWPDATLPVDDIVATTCNASVSTSNNSLSQGGFEEVSESLEVEGDELRSKRVKHENKLLKASPLGETLSAPRTVVRDSTDSDTIGDGFRWRKYGQKVVKGNPYPRSYYRCTSPKCNARKYVERTSEEDPGSFITTYEGRHNHGIPIKSTHSEASKKTCKNKS